MKRYEKVKIISILGIIGNIFLLLVKGLVGFSFHSQAMIADFFNSAGDVLSSFITFIGNIIASKPKDDDHNLGHGKAEYIYAMLISIVMIIASLSILKSSFLSIFNHNDYTFSYWLIIICIITILVKFILYIVTKNLAKKQNNLLVKALSIDHRNDLFITLANLFSIFLTYFNIYIFDGIVGCFICLWIIISSFKIFKESYDVLMDKAISESTKQQVLDIIKKHKEVIKVNHFNSTPVGYKYQITFTIYVDGNMSTFLSHEIADILEKEITNTLEEVYLTVIHVNPL